MEKYQEHFDASTNLFPPEGSISFCDLIRILARYFRHHYWKVGVSNVVKKHDTRDRARTVLSELRYSLQTKKNLESKYCVDLKPSGNHNGDTGIWLSDQGVNLILSIDNVQELELLVGIPSKINNNDLEAIQEALRQI